MKNNFIWCDLSTFDIETALDFYSGIFGWKFRKTPDLSMEEDYHIALKGRSTASAVFVMPEYLQEMNMPSFWMSYIGVKNIEEVVDKAKDNGAIIELKPTEFDADSKIALIRDPAGAGFTVYEGKELKGKANTGHGRMVWNVLHINDLDIVENFYKNVFGFSFEQEAGNNTRYGIYNSSKELIAHAEILSDDIKGDKQYWVPIFYVDNIEKFKKSVESLGGSTVFMEKGYEYALFSDSQGASFMVTSTPTLVEFYS